MAPLYVFNSGFLTQPRIRRILELEGYQLRLGRPGPEDLIAVWGQRPRSRRGHAMAERTGARLLHVEDGFLRSLLPGRKSPPLGLTLDRSGLHYDPRQPSDLETLLATAALDDTALLDRARGCMARMAEAHLTKYFGTDSALPCPQPGYVLVIDQTQDDASVTASGANAARFQEMLVFAQQEHPGSRIVIKSHPENDRGLRPGYLGATAASDRISLVSGPLSPWTLMEGAVGVYTVSSQLGFEAILAGHRPRVFGQPFYAGWGLTQDEFPVDRRQRKLTRAQLFAATMLLYPRWYDPFVDKLCPLERLLDLAEAEARAWREDRHGWQASQMRHWKRQSLQRFFGRQVPVQFGDTPATPPRRRMVWASAADPQIDAVRVEDGFLRSRGLGAALTPPLSLVLDQRGIYYDPTRPSDLEDLIAARAKLRPDQQRRARRLMAQLRKAGLSKYNVGSVPRLRPDGQERILVPGQVEDDASIRLGAGTITTNRALLEAARAAHPDACLIYKPHPDVEAGLRPGTLPDAADLADLVLSGTDPAALLEVVDGLWTMTSLMGFEALIRGVPVTTLGAPFYAGWGLTTDKSTLPERRQARPTLEGLVHATLIDYPRYLDPVTLAPCPAEVVAERLDSGLIPRGTPWLRSLSKLQGMFASHAHRWR